MGSGTNFLGKGTLYRISESRGNPTDPSSLSLVLTQSRSRLEEFLHGSRLSRYGT